MEMEEDTEVEQVFMASEVDIEYEFDAARFFNFSRDETPAEARRAQLWFESAKSYPPSPVVARLILGADILLENVNTSPKSKAVEKPNAGDCPAASGQKLCAMDVNSKGLTFYNHLASDKYKGRSKSSVKASLPRSSTLMKPTASQLAKQNLKPEIGCSRLQMLHVQINDKSVCSSSGVESQAAKRQKLDGGHLHKVSDAKQQTTLIHKMPKREETFDKISAQSKLKLTIPREPDFETTHRAQRMRPRNGPVVEQVTSSHRKFKARLLNRKIFVGPSLPLPTRTTPKLPEFREFHLKTAERAMQNTSTVSSSAYRFNHLEKGPDKPGNSIFAENRNRESRRTTVMGCPKSDGSEVMHNFKALPLNKKIFSSKGDIGVFWNRKRETTVPMEFKFQTERRAQQFPPTELFSKLSLGSDLRPNNGSRLKTPQPTPRSMKDSKENRSSLFQPEHKIMIKEKPSLFGGKQAQFGATSGPLMLITNRA